MCVLYVCIIYFKIIFFKLFYEIPFTFLSLFSYIIAITIFCSFILSCKDSIIILGIILDKLSERSVGMQIEKINNDKLKVILNTNDLKENNIDLNTFMANSLESQDLFLDILDLAEEEFNFYVDNSKLIIEAVSLANNVFIFTITKLSDYKMLDSLNYIYCFENFDDFSNILPFSNQNMFEHLYTYQNKFYLMIDKKDSMNYLLEEFSSSKINSSCLENILIEHGMKCT